MKKNIFLEGDSTMLAEAIIILRCFCRLDQIQIPKFMAERMNKKGSVKWLSSDQPE